MHDSRHPRHIQLLPRETLDVAHGFRIPHRELVS
jgi:hypothetical protein